MLRRRPRHNQRVSTGRSRAIPSAAGIDGAEKAAGAIVTPNTIDRAEAKGVDAKERLADNDGHDFFEALGDRVITGPTLTNVNDFRTILATETREAA